jgi:isoleucyl-tRNA synthetase
VVFDLPQVRESVLEALKPVEFYPQTASNRMIPMLKNRPDWCISRQRKWGVPIFDGPDILDVWFDSGLTWTILNGRQADLYLEGNDQHRGWFQSSLWLSVALTGKAPYKRVVTHGFVVDKNGHKMSKRKGNVIDPNTVVSKYGSEVLQLLGRHYRLHQRCFSRRRNSGSCRRGAQEASQHPSVFPSEYQRNAGSG